MIDLGNEPPKRRWLVPALIVAAVFLVGVLLWTLQSSGTIYSPTLAALAGGVPKDPTKALSVMKTALARSNSYEYNSTVAVTFGSKLPDIAEASDTTISAEASGTVKGQVNKDGSSSTFEFTLGPDYPVVTLKGKTVTAGDQVDVYLDTLGLLVSNNNWKRLTFSDLSEHALSWPLVMGNLYDVLEQAKNGVYRGTTTLQDATKTAVSVYEYQLGSVISPQDATIKEARLVVWIARSNGAILVAKVDGLLDIGVGTIVVQQQSTNNNFGKAELATIPSDAKPVNATIAELYRAFGVGGVAGGVAGGVVEEVAPSGTNDAKRLADLTTLKAALEEYKQDFGLYPLAKERVKSTDINFVLKGSLVPKYLAEIPVDPSGGVIYYGYTSDGFSFTLTSILEDKSSPGAIAGNGYYYQEVRNN